MCRRFGDLIKKMQTKKRIVKIWCKTSFVKVPHRLFNIFLHCSYYYQTKFSALCGCNATNGFFASGSERNAKNRPNHSYVVRVRVSLLSIKIDKLLLL